MSLRKKINLGISLLDRTCPDWHYRVRLTSLDMAGECDCILGQLFGVYEKGMSKLHLSDDLAYQTGFISWFQHKEWFKNASFVGKRLTKAWKKAITAKRKQELQTSEAIDITSMPKYPVNV